MKLPRDVTGAELAKALQALGYRPVRQVGSHMQLTTTQGGEHHVTIPRHRPLRIGTFATILDRVAAHFGVSRAEVLKRIKL